MNQRSSLRHAIDADDPRFRIAAARRILYRNGIDSQVAGHVSTRVPAEEAFLVSPSEYFDETLPDHVMKMGFDLAVLESGPYHAQPGVNFHADIYRARADVNCIIHTHGRNVSIISTLRRPPEPYHSYGALFQDDVALFQDDPHRTPEVEGEAIVQTLGHKRVLLIANHGVVHVGASIEETTAEALMFDFAAGVQIEAMRLGGLPFPRDTAKTYRELFLRISYRRDLWDASFRRLAKTDPDLFA